MWPCAFSGYANRPKHLLSRPASPVEQEMAGPFRNRSAVAPAGSSHSLLLRNFEIGPSGFVKTRSPPCGFRDLPLLTTNVAQNAVASVSRSSVAGTGAEQISELFVSDLTSSPREGQSVLGRAAKAPIARPNSSRTIQPQPAYEAFLRLPQARKRTDKRKNAARRPSLRFP